MAAPKGFRSWQNFFDRHIVNCENCALGLIQLCGTPHSRIYAESRIMQNRLCGPRPRR